VRAPKHERLNRLAEMLAQGMSKTEIARALGISRKTLYEDIAALEEAAAEAIETRPELGERLITRHIDVIEQLKEANRAAWEMLEEFRQKKPYVALGALERIQEQLTLQAKLIGLISSGPQINILQIENFSREVFEVIRDACCPACRERILAGLRARRARYLPSSGPEPPDQSP
jgi:predicted DNA-binding transcriptional regulator YafY